MVLKIFVLFLSFLSAKAAISDVTYVLCKNQKTVRTLRIEKTSGKCQTIYTKNGLDQVIASGYNPTSCQKFLDDVQGNLIKAGWKCREPKESAVSELKENTQ
jgi:hypothetical protein